ncbi:hypothetical protein KUTeg_006180, partial [Tegillarca granosa]
FAKDQFNFGSNTNVGNSVVLYSGTQTYPCTIHKDGCTETQIMCYTAKMPAGKYMASVSVDGTKVPDADHCANYKTNCEFEKQIYSIERTSYPKFLGHRHLRLEL